MALALNIGKCTLLGNYRENNEDSIDVKEFPDMTVCLVADGMGGQAAGEIASKRAIEIVPRELKKHLAGRRQRGNQEHHPPGHRAGQRRNHRDGRPRPRPQNMGTTVVLTVWRKGVGPVRRGLGDSRVYLIRGRKIEQLTVDHSIAQALVEAKTISAGRGAATATATSCGSTSAPRSRRRAGGEGGSLQAGDRFLLCTDGLTGVVTDEQTADYVRSRQTCRPCRRPRPTRPRRGSRDNVSCIVFEVDRGEVSRQPR